MSEDKIHLKIITHEQIVVEADIDELYVEATDGRLGILKNHIPVVCALNIGVGKFVAGGVSTCFTTMGGILQFENNQATILTDIAELDADIDETRAKEAYKRAQARLASKDDDLDIMRAQISLSKAIARLNAKNKHF